MFRTLAVTFLLAALPACERLTPEQVQPLAGGRLRPVMLRSDDGLQLPTGEVFDVELGMKCVPTMLQDKSLRCVPPLTELGKGVIAYSDPECKTEVLTSISLPLFECAYPLLWGEIHEEPAKVDECVEGTQSITVRWVEGVENMGDTYRIEDGSCQRWKYRDMYRVGPALPPEAFVELSVD